MDAKSIWTRREILGAGLAATALGMTALARAAEAGPRIRLGMVTYQVGAEMDLDTLIDVCEKSGMDGVELRTTHKHGVEPSLDAAGRAKVLDRLGKTKVVVRALGSTCEFHSPDPAVVKKNIEEAGQFIQLAADLKIWGVKVRPNGFRKDVPEDATLKQIGAALREVGALAKDKGIALVVECHGTGTNKPANMAKIMEYCGHPSVGLCWNSNDGDIENGSIKQGFELCKPWIRHCHVRALADKSVKYPWPELFALLKEMKYDGYTMIEASTKEDPVKFLKDQRAAFDALMA